MSNPVRITKALATADADGIALSQTPLAAGNLTINGAFASGGVATLDTSRRVLITPAGADAGRTFTIYGTRNGVTISETLAGANNPSTSQSVLDYDTVTRIAVDAATAGAIQVGTSGVGSTPWFNTDFQMHPVSISVAVVVTGTVNYTVQYTYDDLAFVSTVPGAVTPVPVTFNDPVLASETATGETNFSAPITGWRVLINSGTGSLAITGIQAGIQG